MKDTLQFLKELQHERNTQPNDGNADPVFWVLRDYKWEVTEEGYEDRTSIYDMGFGESTSIDDYIDEIVNGERKSDFTEEQINELQESVEWDGASGLLEWVQEHTNDDCYLIHEKEIAFIVPNTLFLTKSEAKKHIEIYHYNYTDKVHTYAMTVLRSPVVEKLLNVLETFDWDSIEKLAEDKSIFLDAYVEKIMSE